MNILITGANGQLGHEFISYFKDNNVTFIESSLSSTINPLDITNIDEIRSFVSDKKIDCIINCAAYNLVDKAESDWENAYKVNSLGVRNLSIVANEINAILVHYSTDYVFDGSQQSPYGIFDIPHPLSKYALSKFYGEQFVRQLANKYFVIRVSWVFGPGKTNFIQKVLDWSNKKQSLKIVADEVSSPTYTSDIVQATLELLNSKIFGLYHFTNKDSCSRFQWAEFILEQVHWNGELLEANKNDFDLPAERPNYSVLDCSDTYNIISFKTPNWKSATKKYLQKLGF